MLQRAIETYEQGFRTDLRDYYPGVNAVTLRLLRGTEDDRSVLKTLTPVVRYSVSSAPTPKNNDERYWQTATRLELATADRDWKAARQHLTDLIGIQVAGWLRETTAANLERQCKSLAEAMSQLAGMVVELLSLKEADGAETKHRISEALRQLKRAVVAVKEVTGPGFGEPWDVMMARASQIQLSKSNP
jgi:hypothetical protein